MTKLLDSALVLCDLDHLLLAGDGNMPQVVRDVLQLFSSRGGRLTVFTQRSPRAVRAVLGGVRLAAPALTCGGTLAYRFSEGGGQPLCSFAGCEESIFKKLPAAVGLGIALQMADGSTRVLRMSTALERHLRREFTPLPCAAPPMSGARTCCASCSIRTASSCPFRPCWNGRWGTMPPCCARSASAWTSWC